MANHEESFDRAPNLALVLLRHLKPQQTQAQFGKAARISADQMSEYERGRRPLPRRILDRAVRAADFPPFLLDPLLRELRSFLAAARGWSSAKGFLVGSTFAELVELLGAAVEAVLDFPPTAPLWKEARPPRAEDREEAEQLWGHLEKLTGGPRLAVVEELEEYQSWALCERVAAASLEEAAGRPEEALKLALLAERIAELVGGPEPGCLRLLGYAGVHVSNARRVNNDVPAAERDFTRARKLWEEGAPEDPGLLSEAVVLGIEATLRDAQRRLPEALQRIDEALDSRSGRVCEPGIC